MKNEKKEVVEMTLESKKKVKSFSKAIYIISKIMKILSIIGLSFIGLLLVITPMILGNIKIKNNEIKFFGEKVNYEIKDHQLILDNDEIDELKVDIKSADINIEKYLNDFDSTKILIAGELLFAFAAATLVLTFFILRNLEKLFKNINEGTTPFTMENSNLIRMIGKLFLITIIVEWVAGIVVSSSLSTGINEGLEMKDILIILVIYCSSYIFEYGCKLQSKSKESIYGDVNE